VKQAPVFFTLTCLWPLAAAIVFLTSIPWGLASVDPPREASPETLEQEAQPSSWAQLIAAERIRLSAEARTENDLANEINTRLDALARQCPIQYDWMLQDSLGDARLWLVSERPKDLESKLIRRVLDELNDEAGSLKAAWETLERSQVPPGDKRWLDLYERACERRRESRLRNLRQRWNRFVFTKHYNLGGSHYAYTEGQSDAQNERHFHPGSALCVCDLSRGSGQITVLLEDPEGVIRDPDVSWDGRRILFSWKKSDLEDDYHLYEWDTVNGQSRPLTAGLGYADYEGAYLPDGGIVFNSTRCVQTVDCWWTEVSNLYVCDNDGRHLRRLTFDQVHDNYPTVMNDGRILYTRWEYSDRGQIFVQGLFQMNADGTSQTEFYGNNSWFPTSLLHARAIPGSPKVMAVFSGHHTLQAGKLGVLDPGLGRQENSGARLIAPVRATEAVRVDAYGQEGDLFQYPYPLSEAECLVSYAPQGWSREPVCFGIYWMHADGRRELLVSDSRISCSQPVPLAPREKPLSRLSPVDYRKTTALCYVQDVYAGPGLAGIPRGTVQRMRVIALDYRAAGMGQNYNEGPAGSALVSTPVAIGNGAWDVKRILGDAMVHADGSAFFKVPARTPVYFQAIDSQGHAVQTMRSWTTLQPGENASCVGCHESKNSSPLAARPSTLALRAGAEDLTPFYGPARGFSFPQEIQPILNRHCARCHPGPDSSLDLSNTPVPEALAKRRWTQSYLSLVDARESELEGNRTLTGNSNEWITWISAQSEPSLIPPYSPGAAKSALLTLLTRGHHGVRLSREELDKLAAWIDLLVPYCGDYEEANTWTPEELDHYRHFLNKRRTMEAVETANIKAFLEHLDSKSHPPQP